ncbi:leucine-rich repeat-containing protein 37A3-like [Hemicordylus capensis]|uniref:leucine-rich repeat-containing protein 37A3-like n=1 Tax=Hemicordylus capensis TaxID=884348 RepID=UPI0023044A18|nr:leucine-rich repeat-containing protein 37A3-like [Hemicordylus capensis]
MQKEVMRVLGIRKLKTSSTRGRPRTASLHRSDQAVMQSTPSIPWSTATIILDGGAHGETPWLEGDHDEADLNKWRSSLIPVTLVRSRLAHVIHRLKVDCTESKVQLACAKMISRLTMLLNLFSEREYVKETSSLWKSYCWPMKNVANLATGNPRKRVNPEIARKGISEYGYGKRLFAFSVIAMITMIMAVICLFEICSQLSAIKDGTTQRKR